MVKNQNNIELKKSLVGYIGGKSNQLAGAGEIWKSNLSLSIYYNRYISGYFLADIQIHVYYLYYHLETLILFVKQIIQKLK